MPTIRKEEGGKAKISKKMLHHKKINVKKEMATKEDTDPPPFPTQRYIGYMRNGYRQNTLLSDHPEIHKLEINSMYMAFLWSESLVFHYHY